MESVYVLRCDALGMSKIGRSKNVFGRHAAIQLGIPARVELIKSWRICGAEGAGTIEIGAQRRLVDSRVTVDADAGTGPREWFRVDAPVAKCTVSTLVAEVCIPHADGAWRLALGPTEIRYLTSDGSGPQFGEAYLARLAQVRRTSSTRQGGDQFGFKRNAAGRVVRDDAESAVIAEIDALYAAGVTTPQIAAILNGRGVPTKRGAPTWSSTTVQGILSNRARIARDAAELGDFSVPLRGIKK